MRLLEIKIRNIASLKGDHLISFRDLMSESPLFAITGETGSGKSSILNSIGLALYGRVFKSSVQQNDVVTLGEKEGQIELLFQVREKTYLSIWRAKVRKQNGELYSTPQSPTRDLYEVSGTQFDSPKTISDKKIEDILHLDYDQFCKCVILNQGEFARFLSSSFSERKDILEKLYPGDILEGLSGQLRQDLESCRREKETLEVEMNTLQGTGASGEDLKVRHDELKSGLAINDEILAGIETLDSEFRTLHHYFEENLKNQKKLEVVKSDIGGLTTMQNEKMLRVKAAQEAFESIHKKQEDELPKLQELLKLEEKLTGLEEQASVMLRRKTTLELELLQSEKNLALTTKKDADESATLKSISDKLSHPVEQLRLHEKNLLHLFEISHERNLLKESHSFAQARLSEIESAGKEKSLEAKELEAKIAEFPKDLAGDVKRLQSERDELEKTLKEKEKKLILAVENKKNLASLEFAASALKVELETTEKCLIALEVEAGPLRTTRQLSTLLTAVTVCRTHETTLKSHQCPVCESQIPETQWTELRKTLNDETLENQMQRLEEIEKELIRLAQDKQTSGRNLSLHLESIVRLQAEIKTLEASDQENLTDPKELEEKITRLKIGARELEGLKETEKKLQLSLTRTREEYALAKKGLQEKTDLLDKKNVAFKAVLDSLTEMIKDGPSAVQIGALKSELATFKEFREKETLLGKIQQEKKYLLDAVSRLKTETETSVKDYTQATTTMKSLKETLFEGLKGEKASALIQSLTQKVKLAQDDFRIQEAELKKHDLLMKETTSRLLLLNELLRDLELQFIRSRDLIRNEAVKRKLYDRESLDLLHEKLKTLSLDFQSPPELFIPVKELLSGEKDHFAKIVTTLKDELSATVARLADWEKRQDKITLLSLKNKDLQDRLNRLERLYDVLGKDELRTFVLSLVEENLIEQTNDELQKLCQGRYEIVHQSRRMKLTPEFYVLDKFREGGLRKVATLSGGETFMVSLAMALALAEMTRGQAEIDSLFIDEGFGTLDQDSLEDVLEMLNQIQTRGLMVGIISHIKTLTNALPVNLLLSKRQDGTSTLSLQYN